LDLVHTNKINPDTFLSQRGIGPGQKWWRNTNFTQPMGRLSMHSKCLEFIFLLSLGEVGLWRNFFIFPLFPTCSLQVPNEFPSK
jgi:hypothetical protein